MPSARWQQRRNESRAIAQPGFDVHSVLGNLSWRSKIPSAPSTAREKAPISSAHLPPRNRITTHLQSDVGLSLDKLARHCAPAATVRGALAADRESLEIARALADKEPGNKQFRTDVVLALWRLASVGDNPRERLTEALKILKNLKLAAMLTPAQEEWIATIEDDLSKIDDRNALKAAEDGRTRAAPLQAARQAGSASLPRHSGRRNARPPEGHRRSSATARSSPACRWRCTAA